MMQRYVVVLTRPHAHTPSWRAEVVEARTPTEAVTVALEGERWETEDGRYEAHVGLVDELEKHIANRATETTVTIEVAQ